MKRLLILAAAIASTTTTLFGFADLKIDGGTPTGNIHAGSQSSYRFLIQNIRGENAANVVVNVSSNVPISCKCSLGTVFTAGTTGVVVTFTAPSTSGPVTLNATVTSDTSDPDLSNNSAFVTVMVSTDPDVYVHAGAPSVQDLAVPFPMGMSFGNNSNTDAHDVDITLNFRPDVSVQSLPANCGSPSAGLIICHAGTVAANTSGVIATTLVAQAYGSGSITFTGTATERESDFDPLNNTTIAKTTLYDTFYVTTTADGGPGSLRQAIVDADAACFTPMLCAIFFHIDEPSSTPWKTITVVSPLPPLTASALHIDGATQTRFSGDTNADGPEIEISGGGTVDGDGLLVATCGANIANLSIGGFLRNGISVTAPVPGCGNVYYTTELFRLFLGTDPTGSAARPNARGVGTSVPNGDHFNHEGLPTNIAECVISGNIHSGIFGMAGRLSIRSNRIGVKAHSDDPLPNGASGVFIGAGGYGSDVGADFFGTNQGNLEGGGNVIAFNGETGVAIAAAANQVEVRNNRIWGNRLLGIDIGLDGPTASSVTEYGDRVFAPVLTLARFDPTSNKTIIEGDVPTPSGHVVTLTISFYASDDADPSGYGEGQRPMGLTRVTSSNTHFHFEADGDLRGQWITATNTWGYYAVPGGFEPEFLTQTSDFSRGLTAN